ncbi:hypothetical protein DZG00_09770 [Clavibacter lycopersici]|uniref:GNAT-like C-terminal domain-containing protein n=1 Tax=Clavibacter lycopersici TaxID=2301718 RepID=A0A399T8K5_9MICO|nr:acyltransferase domain-containing protein [Clavibacter lycopersici]RIJ51212.1 hypothetical protein DZG00_09770 [Clavibacter lycopersici]RIJ59986.1 hypothetical protein DZG02_10810 [Clavibacter lycopersici]
MSASLLGVAGTAAADPALADVMAAALDSGDADALGSAARMSPAPLTAAAIAGAVLALEPRAIARHRALGIPEEVTARSLADVGRKLDAYGAAVDLPWLVRVLRGDVLAFGRIQLERETVDGSRALHIPEGGPLVADELDRSLAEGRAYLGADPVVCTSWLLDPLLRELPEPSNIAAFARRFRVDEVVRSAEADASVARFVFRRPLPEVIALPADARLSRLQALVLGHLRSGAHWSEPRGLLL